MVNDMKNIKCQDNNLWNLHVEGKHRVENFNSLIISSNRVNFSFFFFFSFQTINFSLEEAYDRTLDIAVL